MRKVPINSSYRSRPRILVACEESQAVTSEFRRIGLDAFSCDIHPCSGKFTHCHFQCDIREILLFHWDMIIAFPPCTYLTSAGNRHFSRRICSEESVAIREAHREEAAEFFMLFVNHPCQKIAIENPVGYMNRIYRKPDQVINPYQFGDLVEKRTCLWLKNLPKLKPYMNKVNPKKYHRGKWSSTGNKFVGWTEALTCPGGHKARAKQRSKTFPGIAKAMASQWGGLLK